MKKILILILPFMFLSTVKAEECVNLLNNDIGQWNLRSDINYYYYSEDSSQLLDYHIPVDASTTYTLFIEDGTTINSITQIIGDGNLLINHTTTSPSLTFTTLWNSTYIRIATNAYSSDFLSSARFWLVKGDSVCTPTTEEPSEPVIPGGDSTLDDFYSIYLDKLSLLANYAKENKFVLSFVGIILLFVVLEIILFLFNRGGYRR